MKYWIIIHYYSSYEEHNDLIGLPAKTDEKGNSIKRANGSLEPYYKYYNDVSVGDKFAYYCPAPNKYVLGLFEIIDGPGRFATNWSSSIHYKIKPVVPIKKENFVSYYDLVEKLEFFKEEDGKQMKKRSAPFKLMGTAKEITKDDFDRIHELYAQEETKYDTEIESQKSKDISEHIFMIQQSHIRADQFQCESFIGKQERNRVKESIQHKYEEQADPMDQLPSWLANISVALGTNPRINYIDNIWFYEESKGFYIPFAIFEHEKDENLRGVMDRFNAMNNTLNSNPRFRTINPLYIIVARDKSQADSYKNKINEHGEWDKFSKSHKFYFFSTNELKKLNNECIRIFTTQIREISESKNG